MRSFIDSFFPSFDGTFGHSSIHYSASFHQSGARLESRDTEDRHCLHIALEEGSEACAVHFIQAGCDVNAVDGNGRSCLYLATHSPHLFSTKVIQALLTQGENDFES